MSVRLVAPGSLVEVRRLPVECYASGTARTYDFEVLAITDEPECRVQCSQAGWLLLSTYGGTTWVAIPANAPGAMTGPNLGPLTAGQRLPIKIQVAVPGGTFIRTRSVALFLGLGT